MKTFHLICENCGSDDVTFKDYFAFSSKLCRELTDVYLSCGKCAQLVTIAAFAANMFEEDNVNEESSN